MADSLFLRENPRVFSPRFYFSNDVKQMSLKDDVIRWTATLLGGAFVLWAPPWKWTIHEWSLRESGQIEDHKIEPHKCQGYACHTSWQAAMGGQGRRPLVEEWASSDMRKGSPK